MYVFKAGYQFETSLQLNKLVHLKRATLLKSTELGKLFQIFADGIKGRHLQEVRVSCSNDWPWGQAQNIALEARCDRCAKVFLQSKCADLPLNFVMEVTLWNHLEGGE